VVPVTAVAVVVNESVPVVVVIIPTVLVMVIGLGDARAGGDKKKSENGLEEMFLNEFHLVKDSHQGVAVQ
jgi:hypothetical protein